MFFSLIYTNTLEQFIENDCTIGLPLLKISG